MEDVKWLFWSVLAELSIEEIMLNRKMVRRAEAVMLLFSKLEGENASFKK